MAISDNAPIKKLIIFSHDTRIGGATTNILRLIQTMHSLYKLEVVVITMCQGDMHDTFLPFGPVYVINANFTDKISAEDTADPLLQRLSAEGFHHVIANTVISGILTYKFKCHGMTVVSLIHEMPTLIHTMGLTKSARDIANYSDYIVFASPLVRDAFPFFSLVEKRRIKILEQGVLHYRFPGSRTESRRELRTRFRLTESAKIILGCGVGEARKGVDLLPQLMASLVKNIPDVYCIWLGEIFNSEFRSWVEHDIAKLNLTDRFFFLSGFESNPAVFFEGADLFLLPSREDPYPSVVLEAMKIGLPCIAFMGSGGAQSMLAQGRGGLVPYLDLKKLTEKSAQILTTQEDERTALTSLAAHFAAPLTYERYAAELLSLLLHPGEDWPMPLQLDRYHRHFPSEEQRILHCLPSLDAESVVHQGKLFGMRTCDNIVLTACIAPQTPFPFNGQIIELHETTPFCVMLERINSLSPDYMMMYPTREEARTDSLSRWLKNLRLAADILSIPIRQRAEDIFPSVECAERTPPKNKCWQTGTESISRILIAIHGYELGGGEVVARRVANEMTKYCTVFMYNARPHLRDDAFFANLSPDVIILPSTGNPLELRKYVEIIRPDVINSHVWWSEIVVYQAIHDFPVPWVLTTHGCHETLLAVPECDPRHAEYGVKVLCRADRVVYVAEKNRTILQRYPEIGSEKYVKMLNGYAPSPCRIRSRKELGIAPEDVVFCLISRAIPEKGWEEAIECTLQLVLPAGRKAHLVLVGDGEMRIPLQERYQNHPQIHFTGLSANPMEWIGISDIGLLPTRYIVESQPLVIGEFISAHKPVISTDIGDIPNLLTMDGYQVGIVCPLTKDMTIPISIFTEAMQKLAIDAEMYDIFRKNTEKVAQKFSIESSCRTMFGDLDNIIRRYKQ